MGVELTDEQIQEIADKAGKKVLNTLAVAVAKDKFEKEFKTRSFSGRNADLGPMIKCVVCKLRHRDSVGCQIKYANKPGTPEGDSAPMVADTKHFRPMGNPFWRAKPGKTVWIEALKKFITITR